MHIGLYRRRKRKTVDSIFEPMKELFIDMIAARLEKKKIEKKISKIPRKHGLNGNIVVTMVVTGSLICLLLANPLK